MISTGVSGCKRVLGVLVPIPCPCREVAVEKGNHGFTLELDGVGEFRTAGLHDRRVVRAGRVVDGLVRFAGLVPHVDAGVNGGAKSEEVGRR